MKPEEEMEEEFDLEEEEEDELVNEADCYCDNWFDDHEDDVYVPYSVRCKQSV